MSALFTALRYAWAGPVSAVGLAFAAISWALGARVRARHGVLEVAGGRLAALAARVPRVHRFEAITLGHVLFGHSTEVLERHRAHELVHVRQFERWGVWLVPAYMMCSAFQWFRGRRAYWDNPFEREARAGERSSR